MPGHHRRRLRRCWRGGLRCGWFCCHRQSDRRHERDTLHERVRVLEQCEHLGDGVQEAREVRRPSGVRGVRDLVDVDADAAQFFDGLRVRHHDALGHGRCRNCFRLVGLRRRRRSRRFAGRGLQQHAGGISARSRIRIDGGLLDGLLVFDGESHREGRGLRNFLFTGGHVYVSHCCGVYGMARARRQQQNRN